MGRSVTTHWTHFGPDLLINMYTMRLAAFTLLAAAWYFTSAEGVVIYTCHNDTAEINCDVGSKIKLNHILYKVGVGTRCGEGKRHPEDGPDNYCSFPWAEMVVEDLCTNKRSCKVPVTEMVFGEYPCKEATRYLEINYECATPGEKPDTEWDAEHMGAWLSGRFNIHNYIVCYHRHIMLNDVFFFLKIFVFRQKCHTSFLFSTMKQTKTKTGQQQTLYTFA